MPQTLTLALPASAAANHRFSSDFQSPLLCDPGFQATEGQANRKMRSRADINRRILQEGEGEESLQLAQIQLIWETHRGKDGFSDQCSAARQKWHLIRRKGTWRGTRVTPPNEILTLTVRFSSGAGGGAQAGITQAADGNKAGNISCALISGCLSPSSISSISKKKITKHPLHLLILNSCLFSPMGTD